MTGLYRQLYSHEHLQIWAAFGVDFHLLSRGRRERSGLAGVGNANRAVLNFDCNRFGHKLLLSLIVNENQIERCKSEAQN